LNEGVSALTQYFESASLHQFEVAYDVHNTVEMKVRIRGNDVKSGIEAYALCVIVICKCTYCIGWRFKLHANLCSEASYIL
jgi:hypothetical protein